MLNSLQNYYAQNFVRLQLDIFFNEISKNLHLVAFIMPKSLFFYTLQIPKNYRIFLHLFLIKIAEIITIF